MLRMYGSRVSGNTTEPSARERRLDSLARLLGTNSEHTAVCLINKTLHVAAVEFSKELSSDNPILNLLREVLGYFAKVARREIVGETERKALFEKLCTPERFKTELRGKVANAIWYGVPNELYKQVAMAAFAYQDPKVSEFRRLYGGHEDIALLLYTRCSRVINDFCKLERTLRSDQSEYSELRQALAKENIRFLQNETVSGVHPEVQILSVIIQLIAQKQLKKEPPAGKKIYTLYIGTSQYSYLESDMLMVAARHMLKPMEKISVRTRGNRHGPTDWRCPDGFCPEKSAHMPKEEWTSVAQMIYKNRKEFYTEHSDSSSEEEPGSSFLPMFAASTSAPPPATESSPKRVKFDNV